MLNKFVNVPTEPNTKIIFEQETQFGEYDVLYQKWFWDGVTAESLIFKNEDVTGLADDEIKAEVKTSPIVKIDSKITLVRSKTGFTFVNFNFETE